MPEKITDNIYKITVPLPITPLKSINVYVIRGERNLMIDTGFNTGVCLEALTDGMAELGIAPENTDIFITHLHSDHAGLAWRLQRPGTRVYISETDYPFIDVSRMEEYWTGNDGIYLAEGFSEKELAEMPVANVARAFSPAKNCDFTYVADGDILSYGGRRLRVVNASGHTPGQKCLFDEENGVMFLADHILFDITPTVQIWEGTDNPLGDYIASLRRFRGYDIKIPLPAHRGVTVTAAERADQIIAHHRARLDETMDNVLSRPDSTAYDIASHMTWHIREKGWENYPLSQKWFAVGEILAHLRYLEVEGKVIKYRDGALFRYAAAE